VLLFLILLGLPVGFSFILTSFAGLVYLTGLNGTLHAIGSTAYEWTSDYTFAAVPLFILMGHFAHNSGISRDLYEAGHKWIGRVRGGLAMATVVACGGFAALSGSSLATAAAMGNVSLPEMQRLGYSRSLSTGTVAAGGTIGILIPPSIPLIIYGLLANESISKLFMAGILPGILEALIYMLVIFIICTLDPGAGPSAPSFSMREKWHSLLKVWPMLMIFLMIMGGIYLGIATPTEAASIGALGSFLFILFRGRLTWKNLTSTLMDTGVTATMMITILVGAMIFSIFLSMTGIPRLAAEWITSLNVNRYVVLGIVMFIYIPLGCIMDSLAMIVLTVPLFFPTLAALGFNPLLLGILAVKAIEIGQITPPVGINVFIIKGIAKDVPIGTIFKGVIPFFISDIVNLVILVAFPRISLLIPGLMK
ncbi:MAG: TRAP transporter large permease, partial [Desulfobacterales bacterium]|nr:TRAP transporter large permease [Desulfobacterales bacterium]